MDRDTPDRGSLGSSLTEEDLGEARLRLLEHQGSLGDLGPDDDEAPLLAPPPQPPVTRSRGYGSVASSQSEQQLQPRRRRKPAVKRYRLPFLILLAFEWGLIVFLSIICSVSQKTDPKTSYFEYNITTSHFDVVTIGTFRLVCIVLFYIVLGWVSRIVMAIATLVPALYIPIKAYYSWSIDDPNDALRYLPELLLLFVAFVIPWFTAFFFEFKYLTSELARLHSTSWTDWRVWLWPRALLQEDEEDTPSLPEVVNISPAVRHHHPYSTTASTLSLDFRTPAGSSRGSPTPLLSERQADDELDPIMEEEHSSSSLEMAPAECDQNALTGDNLRYKQESSAALEAFMTLITTDEGWHFEKKNDTATCYSRQGAKGKIIKGEGIIDLDMDQLWSILYPGDLTPDWNPQCSHNEVLLQVDRVTDVLYTVSNAMGPVSSRDFVSARQVAFHGNTITSAIKSTKCSLKGEQPGRVRAQNGPTGYYVEAIASNRTKFVWIIDSDLKGWLPQTVIDQALSGALLKSFQNLRQYIDRERVAGRLH